MGRVRLSVLGGFQLHAESRPLRLPVKKAQALVAYLALRPGRPHARETLTGLLWGDMSERQARQNLRQTVFRLRKVFAAARNPGFVARDDDIALDAVAVQVDAIEFSRLARKGTLPALEAAAALYEGPLLDGLHVGEPPFDEWLLVERERFRETAQKVLTGLLVAQTKQESPEAAVQTATRLLALDPLQEAVHRTLMRLYVRQDRRGTALRQYQSCVAQLQRELGVEPETETKRLYQTIVQQRVRPGPATRTPGGRAGRPSPRTEALITDTPLIGRQDEIARWRTALRDVARSRGRAWFVTGEAGIGKTRLVEEMMTEASRQGSRVLVGRAYETEQILPFRPWVDALRAARVFLDLEAVWAAYPAWRVELARLFPELAGRGLQPSITAESHLRLFETKDGVLGQLASGQPLLVVLEDLHWADDMSLRLLSFVARRLESRPIALVATSRDEELANAPVLPRLLEELRAAPHVAHLQLGPLSTEGTTALVRALARVGHGDDRVARLAGQLQTISEGNPLVIVETMRRFHGELPDVPAIELPPRVRDMITARLERLSPRARQLASVAAVIEREFGFPLLQHAAGFSRSETAEGLEELVRRRVIDAVGERFDFTHVRIRTAVYDAVLAPRRQAFHAAVGEALQSAYAGREEEVYDRLAYHFSRADEPAQAVTYLVHLADKAARSYALEEAARVLQDALRHGERLPQDEGDRRRLDVVYRLTYVLSLLGRSTEAWDLLLRQESVIARLREASLNGVHHFWLANISGNLGETERAFQHAKRALEEAARCGDETTMGLASYELALQSYIRGHPLEGIAHGRQAVALLERTDEHWWLGRALFALVLNLFHIGDFVPALATLDRLRHRGEATGDRRLQATAAWATGRTYTLMGDPDAAIAACRRGVELASDPVFRATALGYLGAAYLENEELAQAIPLLQDAIAQHQQLGSAGGYRHRQLVGLFTAWLREAHLGKGEIEQARDLASKALVAGMAGGWPVSVGYAERAVGRVALASGRLDEAEAFVRRALQTFLSVDARCQVARCHLVLADVSAARGDRDAARAELEIAHEMFSHMPAPRLVERTERMASALGLNPGLSASGGSRAGPPAAS